MISTRKLLIAVGVVVLALAVAIPSARSTLGFGLSLLATGQLAQFGQYLQSLGPWAPVASILLMIAGALAIPLPVAVIMVANGLAFGLWGGVLVSLLGGLIGAVLAYGIGRFLGRSVLARLVPVGSLQMADRLMAKYGPWAIVLERWIPGVPGDPASYVAGVTRMPPLNFLALTALGLVPSNLVTVYLGAEVAGDVPREYWILGWLLVGVVAAVASRGRVSIPWSRGRVSAKNGTSLVSDEGSSVAPPPS